MILGSFFFGGLAIALYSVFSIDVNPKEELEKIDAKSTQNQSLVDNPIKPDSEDIENISQNERIITKPQTIEEKTAKYLNEFHVEFNHDDIRPAQVVTNGKKCMAFNKYGDLLNLSQVQCLDLSMGAMPKAKQFTQSQTTAQTNDVAQSNSTTQAKQSDTPDENNEKKGYASASTTI